MPDILFLWVGDTLTQTPKLLDILIQTINKAVNQSSQSQLVTEALTACCLLAKFSVVDDIQSGTQSGLRTLHIDC